MMSGEQQANSDRTIIAMSAESGLDAPTRGTSEEEFVFSFGDILRVLWRRLWLILLCMLLFTGTAIGYSVAQAPVYEASTKVWVGQGQAGDASDSNLSASDIQGLQILTKTVAEAIDTRRVAEVVIEELNLPMGPGDLMNYLGVEQVSETQFVKVTYQDTNPVRAQEIASAYGDAITKEISEISTDASAVTATVWEEASVRDDPVSPKPLRNGLLGLVLGAMLGVTLALLLEAVRESWRSAEEVERVSGVPTVGVIPKFAPPRGKKKQG